MICFHLGYPKAGSTTLQKALFNRHPDIVNLGLYPQNNKGMDTITAGVTSAPIVVDEGLRELHELLVQRDGISFPIVQAKTLWEKVKKYYGGGGRTIVFSNEGLLSSRFANPEITEKINRVRLLCPESKILILIRSQLAILKSLYRDHPFDPRSLKHRPRAVSFSEFIEIDLNEVCHSHTNTLDFERVYARVCELFDKDNILMLPLELLMQSPDAFCHRLSEFLDIDEQLAFDLLQAQHENMGPTRALNNYRKLRNASIQLLRYIPMVRSIGPKIDTSIRNFMAHLGKTEEIRVSPYTKGIVNERFAYGNKVLAQQTGLPLVELGYAITSKNTSDEV